MLQSAAPFRLIDLCLAMTVYLPVWHSHCTRADSLFWCHCHAVLILQFTHARYFACSCRWSNLRTVCSTIGLHCVTITRHQILKDLLQVMVLWLFPHVTRVANLTFFNPNFEILFFDVLGFFKNPDFFWFFSVGKDWPWKRIVRGQSCTFKSDPHKRIMSQFICTRKLVSCI